MRVVDSLWGHIWAKHRKMTLIFLAEWAFLIVYGILSFHYMGAFIQSMINKSLVISPTSDLFTLWQKPPVQPQLRIYMFNITNSDRWLSGDDEKLNVEEIGPYVYQEIWSKKNITFHRYVLSLC